jgi:hypothetical protein
MLGDRAKRKETLSFDVTVICPECGSGEATVLAGRKTATARVECPDCGIVRQGVIDYGGGVEVGSR